MIETLQEFKELKNIDKETMINVLEESFRNVIAKMFGTDENFDVIINPEKGDFEIWRNRVVMEDGRVENPNLQISLSDAHAIDPDCSVGEDVTDEVHFADFGRRAILNLRQTLSGKIMELQKDNLSTKYKALVGHIVVADVYQVWKREIMLLDDDGNELLLPKNEQIPGDYYAKGQSVRAVVQRVETEGSNMRIYLSRTDRIFLQRLFEMEVPEINDGLITIKAIARIPGERAKIAVESYDDRIDPVGACVGMKGSRIRGIVRELKNENIDVVNYSGNTALFIQRALSPAKISNIRLYEDERKAEVSLRPEEVSLAIGKGGMNIKLACMLTDYTIDVFRDVDAMDEEDIYLDEFSDEIDGWVIEALKNIGSSTAKAVLALKREEIIERADLEEQTVDDVLRILKSEFEDEYPVEAEEEGAQPDGETKNSEDSAGSEEEAAEPDGETEKSEDSAGSEEEAAEPDADAGEPAVEGEPVELENVVEPESEPAVSGPENEVEPKNENAEGESESKVELETGSQE
jgi:N utilization substance protein A